MKENIDDYADVPEEILDEIERMAGKYYEEWTWRNLSNPDVISTLVADIHDKFHSEIPPATIRRLFIKSVDKLAGLYGGNDPVDFE